MGAIYEHNTGADRAWRVGGWGEGGEDEPDFSVPLALSVVNPECFFF